MWLYGIENHTSHLSQQTHFLAVSDNFVLLPFQWSILNMYQVAEYIKHKFS